MPGFPNRGKCPLRETKIPARPPVQLARRRLVSTSACNSCRASSAAGSWNTCRLELHDGMMHARHSPASIRLPAHGHAAAMQSPALRFDRELVLVPDSVTDWVKCAFADFQQRWRRLMKVAVTEIADHFFPAIKLSTP